MVITSPTYLVDLIGNLKSQTLRNSITGFPNLLISIFDVSGIGVEKFLFVFNFNKPNSSFIPTKASVYDLLCLPDL